MKKNILVFNHSVSAFFLLAVLTVLLSYSAIAQNNNKSKIPAADLLKIIKTRSIHRNSVAWGDIEPKFTARLDKAQTDEQVLNAFVALFGKMNDVHSAIIYRNNYYSFYKGVDEQTAQRVRPLLALEQAQAGKVKTAFLENNYGYILIPTIQAAGITQINEYAQTIQNELCKPEFKSVRGWIVDLRLNGGGNMYPMLAGLGNFFGNETVGGSVDVNDRPEIKWSLKNGDFYMNKERETSVGRKCRARYQKMPVAVLLGSITRSSGEAAAIAFKGRPRTRLIGEPTAEGYTTSNDWIPINDELILNLSTGYMNDRAGNVYKKQVLPDLEITGGDFFDDLPKDQKIKAALDWLNKTAR